MRVYYIGSRYDGCYYVRCLLPLVANGWDGEKTSMNGDRASNEQKLKGAMNADVVVFHRPDQRAMVDVIPLLRAYGKKVVFDNDDTYIPNSGIPTAMATLNTERILEKINANLYEAAANSDLVTVTTEHLAKEYQGINKNVAVLPNMVDPYDWGVPKRNKGKKIRIGLIGSVVITQDYDSVKNVLKELSDRDDIQLVVLGIPPDTEEYSKVRETYHKEIKFWNSLDIEEHPFVDQGEYNDLLNDLELDIALIPRHDSYFNRAKSNLKFLEMSMLEVPVVAQGFESGDAPYQGKDEPYMKVFITEDEAREQLLELINDKKARTEMGKKAKEYVMTNYNVYDNAELWENIYKKLME